MSWIQYDTNGRIYLDFDVPITLKSFLKQDAVTLWAEIFPKIELDEQQTDHDELWIQSIWITLHVDWQLRNPCLSCKYKRQLTAEPKRMDINIISLHNYQSKRNWTRFPLWNVTSVNSRIISLFTPFIFLQLGCVITALYFYPIELLKLFTPLSWMTFSRLFVPPFSTNCCNYDINDGVSGLTWA